MRRNRAGLAALSLPLSVGLLASCSQPAEQMDEDTLDDLSIASGTTGGVFYPVGGAMAEVINNEVEGVSASTEATAASAENMRLIGGGESEVAIVQGDTAYQAVHGEGDFEGDVQEAQVLTVLYPNVYHAVSLESIHEDQGFDCMSDVEGSRFSVGAPGSGNEIATDLLFQGLGMDFDDVDVQRYAYAETANALREGQLDAGSWVVGEGHASLLELEQTDPVHLIPMCEDEQSAVVDEHDFYTAHTIEGGTYETVEEDVETLALWNVVVVSPDFPEELAYDLLDALYENIDDINQVYEPGTEYHVPETMAESPVELHPAAVRYAEDNDIEIPEELTP
ncbi:TAXI family TRAP transporter solute-binding subunit [Allosalinactinospora lopnorensis]|uniref:TAXI family TRAP transporter solute-binding subunit n=1 Tax=Allosalinactinospora lopnorensis TaxID=1352348 RepID=UPI000623FA5E|nr:TAXI family TRAP transporter solute-binding subunit [Allosalinactinospora lopnorensis]